MGVNWFSNFSDLTTQAKFDFSNRSPPAVVHPKDRELERKRYLAAKLEQER